MTALRHRSLWVLGVVVGLWLFLPAFAVLPMSFNATNRLSIWPENRSLRLYEQLFGNEEWSDAILRSLGVGMVVALLSVVLGVAAALGIARGLSRRRGLALNAVIIAPIIIPVVIAAIAS
jgi:ABC-type spermidine/putrescine transport system permease subunit II